MSEKITIIGDGAMATVCGIMLAENGHNVRIWSAFQEQAKQFAELRENRPFLPGVKIPDNIEITGDDSIAFKDATIAVSAVPSQFTRNIWNRLAPFFPEGLSVCSVTKGIENETLQRPTEIISEILKDRNVSVAMLSGPSIAPEIVEKLPATVTVASADRDLASRIQKMISRPYFRVYTSTDVVGVELAGSIKNVIAIAAGLIDGLKLGHNAKSALLARGLAEITRLGVAFNANPETFAGLSGMGDLVTTCTSPDGRNRSFGEAIGQGKTIEEALAETQSVVEGVATTKSVAKMAKEANIEMPLVQAIFSILFENQSPTDTVNHLMNRPLKSETDLS